MSRGPLILVFATTLFISAFLLFAVQPMAGKMLLPLLGGGPSVWNTAMVFFQAMLLAGYAYAHLMAKFLSLRLQGLLHVGLMAIFVFWLPLALPQDAVLPENQDQALWQLGVMFVSIGGPFFILAASAPLFQHWFASSEDEQADNPYFLYAVSNAGSLGALLLYPLMIEPQIGLQDQTFFWAGGYMLLAVAAGLCIFLVQNGRKPVPEIDGIGDEKLSWKIYAAWVGLAFIPSSLMLGVTTIITTDIASAPFLWVLPLALYLLTFIMAFAQTSGRMAAFSKEMAGYAMCFTVMAFMINSLAHVTILPLLLIHLTAFFFCALFCHSELARMKPNTEHLTAYYLLISVGGVLGGLFNAIVAPNLFTIPLEYALVLGTIGFIIWGVSRRDHIAADAFNASGDPVRKQKAFVLDCILGIAAIYAFTVVFLSDSKTVQSYAIVGIFFFLFMIVGNRRVFAITALIALIMFEPTLTALKGNIVLIERNYFGVLKVISENNIRRFAHGTTLHGSQMTTGSDARLPTTYYSVTGPTGDVFKVLSKREGTQKIGVLGLGVGSVACYTAPGRSFDFYEIDKDVADIATNPRYFTYLSNCRSPYKIILGDARQKIADAPDGFYDLIFIDTFSSDNIPIHIITREALDLYKRKLAPNGFIAVNISNRYLNLKPVVHALSSEAGMVSYFKFHTPRNVKTGVESLYSSSHFAVIATEPKDVAALMEDYNWQPYIGPAAKVWTDDYANILSSLWFGNSVSP